MAIEFTEEGAPPVDQTPMLDPTPIDDGSLLETLSQDESRRLATFWKEQVDQVDDVQKKWVKRGRMIEKRYRDDRNRSQEEGTRRYSALWANVETLAPTLYGREPQAVVERKFRDRDPVGRAAATILERGLRNELEISDLNAAVEAAVQDYLLPGRGVAWVRYEPEFGPGLSIPVETATDLSDAQGPIDEENEDEDPEEEKLADTGDRVVRESAPIDHIDWEDFYMFPARARKWKEVTAVGKRCYLSRDQMKERFGKKIGTEVPLRQPDEKRKGQNSSIATADTSHDKGEIFEIWDREDKRVYWYADGYEYLCDLREDPLELEKFFPVPKPLTANGTNKTLLPVPDFVQYQDQAIQIDELTQRIALLTKACKVAGVYNAQSKDIARLFDEVVENELIPVDAWAAFAEKGGVAGQMALLPIKDILGVLNEVIAVRQKMIADMDRLTGIPDVMRGTTDNRETMGGQKLRANYSSIRIQNRQKEVARFCRDIIRLQADVMCKHFTPRSLIEASSALQDEGLGGDMTMVPVGSIGFPKPASGGQTGTPPMIPGSQPMPLSASPLPSGGLAAGAPPVPPAPPGLGPGVSPQGGLPEAPGPFGSPMMGHNQGPPLGAPGGANVIPFPGGPPQNIVSAPPVPQVPMAPRGLQLIVAAIELLRNERLRGFRVDIETDSTIAGDAQEEKASRVEFLTAVTRFMGESQKIVMVLPEAAPLMAKFLQFGVRGFRVSRDLESAIDDFCDTVEKTMEKRAASGPPVDPKIAADQQKSQADTERVKIETAGELQRQTLENQGADKEAQMEYQIEQLRTQANEMNARNEALKNQVELLKEQNRAKELDQEPVGQKMGTLK